MTDLQLGLIGVGAIGQAHLERINTKLKGGRVVAVADPHPEFGKSVAEKLQLKFFERGEDLIQNKSIDAVIVTTADQDHEVYCIASLTAGKFVFCEKPLAPQQDGCKRIVEKEMAGGKKLLQVGFMRRYDYGYRQLKKYISERTLGEPLMIHCAHRNFDFPEHFDTAAVVEATMIHEIDVIRWLLDEDYATVEVVFPKKTKYAGDNLQDPQIMILTTNTGVRIDVEAFVNCRYGYDIRCEVCCEEGTVSLPNPANAVIRTDASIIAPICRSWSDRFVDAYDTEFQEWIDTCREGRVLGPSSWDGYVASITAAAAGKARDTQIKLNIAIPPKPDFYA